MSRFFGEGEDVEQVQVAQQSFEEAGEPRTLTVSSNDFSALEERVLRAVELVKRERLARAQAEQRASEAESQLNEQLPQVEHLQKEVNALRTERDYVRQRVERLLGQLDALEL
ncbi:MAG: hypothetical protein WBQ94_26430 [Terracidiphilus sp.]